MARMLWSPSEKFKNESNLKRYIEWLKAERGLEFENYSELWRWSTDEPGAFWQTMLDYFEIIFEGSFKEVMSDDPMPFTKWFDGIKLNYAEHVFRRSTTNKEAIIFGGENRKISKVSWSHLQKQTASLQRVLEQNGIGQGDCVAGYLPCIPEATVSFLATNSLGAIWSSCSPDFGTQAVLDRFVQIEPKVLIAVAAYQYNGKTFDKSETIEQLVKQIPSLRLLIYISDSGFETGSISCMDWNNAASQTDAELKFIRVPFAHPIWVLFSSGTTGLPKAIVHSNGGILLEQLKYCSFHNNFKLGENCFWYTTTGWMMWNYIHGSLLTGSTMVIYDGSPAYPDLSVLWRFCAEAQINHFGTSAGFILANGKEKIHPSRDFDLRALESIGSTGSTLPPEGFEWVYEHVKKDLWLTSMSGGTDVCSAFVGGNPLWPVYAGEIQCRALGCKLESWDEEGNSLVDEEGEMVITQPMPSMPVYFWNDPEFVRYRESYFEMFPAIWRHGDWIKITPREGVVIFGRSDATLNRGGVRIGTSEIYRAVDKVSDVKDSLIVCLEKKNGEFWMPLFVVMKDGVILTDEIRKKINSVIRNSYSPRHVPDEVIAIAEIPYTISGKKTETPVKKVLMGKDPGKVVNPGSLKNPASLDVFKKFRVDQ